MRCFSTACAVLAILALAIATTRAPAQKPPAGEPKTEPAPLTLEALKNMLDQMGYEYEEGKDDKGQVRNYTVTIARDSWTFVITLSVSGNQELVWLFAPLKKLNDTEQVPSSILLKMLSVNGDQGPPMFEFNERTNRFALSMPLLNRGVTPAILRKSLDRLTTQIRGTESLWNADKWPASTRPPRKDKQDAGEKVTDKG
jgi:hypothetical protein